MRLKALVLTVLALGIVSVPGIAYACSVGQVLRPGDDCELEVHWGKDHWIKAEFPEDRGHRIEFSHIEGDCDVALFGPMEALLSPDQEPVRSNVPGEYHLFTRAITLAQNICRYRIAVD